MTENNNIILPDSLDEFKFDTGYVLWYHSVTEKSWNKNSYINLCEDLPGKVIRNADQLWGIYNALDYNFTAGIFFLMKEGIMPLWEDISNSKGGYWSFKVLKKRVLSLLINFIFCFVFCSIFIIFNLNLKKILFGLYFNGLL